MESVVWFNGACSKSRGLMELLAARGVQVRQRHYLDEPPTVAELEELLDLLGSADATPLLRTKDPAYAANGVAALDRAGQLAALVAHPQMLERPILVHGGRAIVARPPERALEIL